VGTKSKFYLDVSFQKPGIAGDPSIVEAEMIVLRKRMQKLRM
jgi:hypothetical protein